MGTDLCDVDRIDGAVQRQGQRFLNRVFTEAEQEDARASASTSCFLAQQFAGKEACVKALGTGITDRVRWTDIEVSRTADGVPFVVLAGGALRRANLLKPTMHELVFHVSFGGSAALAIAFVVIEARVPFKSAAML